MDAQIIVALIGAAAVVFVGVIAAVMGWVTARDNRKELHTNHGKRPGEYLELIHANQEKMAEDISQVRMWLVDHMRDREAHSYPPRMGGRMSLLEDD